MSLKTPWSDSVNLESPLSEYPRMQMQRGSFTSLNGPWEFQITDGSQPIILGGWEEIIVPFALGSELSGTKKTLNPGEVLWVRRQFEYHPETEMTLLNFEAVDQCCVVYLNGMEAGRHEGGYTPFSLDVSDKIKEHNEILVRISDECDNGLYGYGKQKREHSGMWYTPSCGIWQSVWLEDLPEHAVQDIKITPDCENNAVYLRMAGTYSQIVITVFAGKTLVHRGITNMKDYTIPLRDYHPWSVSDPFLYTMYLQTEDETVKSYFAMRRFGAKRDSSGNMRFTINDQPLYLSGILDQGYNADGLLTYPCEEAMIYDLQKAKALGFNMIRKHVKVECRRWYYLCDLLGILVMQDIPNGGHPYDFMRTAVLPTIGFRKMSDSEYEKNGRSDPKSREAYYRELDEILDMLYNSPCIFAWVPFNEGWGQFDSEEVTAHIKRYDTTRLVDSASGWHDQGCGDFNSRHCYFHSFRAPRSDGRILILSEFGGYSFIEPGHSEPNGVYGYKKFTDKAKWNEAVLKLFEKDVLGNVRRGLSGSVYTQLADVEDECNGLLSADRLVVKANEKKLRKLNERIIRSMK
ncbi:MAG: hypothetical protein IKE16_00015 [Solobacterium sp.]|nr:hypothetical protein [Solobacterium sp.]